VDKLDYRRFKDKYIVRLQKGEEVVETLEKFVKEEKIRLGRITGIGATDNATVGFFDTKEKDYHSKKLTGDMEILNLSGNISEMEGEPYLHLHITLEDAKGVLQGGHLNSAVISATGEIIIDVIDGVVGRNYDDETGLNLFEFE